jgi:hypothetical protein
MSIKKIPMTPSGIGEVGEVYETELIFRHLDLNAHTAGLHNSDTKGRTFVYTLPGATSNSFE